jgi:hypothetical protein
MFPLPLESWNAIVDLEHCVGILYLNYRFNPSTLLLVQGVFRTGMAVPGLWHPLAFKHSLGTVTRDDSDSKDVVPQ